MKLKDAADRVADRFWKESFFTRTAQVELDELRGAIEDAAFKKPLEQAALLFAFYRAHMAEAVAIDRLIHPTRGEDRGYAWGLEGWDSIRPFFDKAWRKGPKDALNVVIKTLLPEVGRLSPRLEEPAIRNQLAEMLGELADEEGSNLLITYARKVGDLLDRLQAAYGPLSTAVEEKKFIDAYEKEARAYLENIPDAEKNEIAEHWDMLREAPKEFITSVRKSPSIRRLVEGLRPALTEKNPVWFKYTVPLIREVVITKERLKKIQDLKREMLGRVQDTLRAFISWLFDELPYADLKGVIDEFSPTGVLSKLMGLVKDDTTMQVGGKPLKIKQFIEELDLGEMRIFLGLVMERVKGSVTSYFERNRQTVLSALAKAFAKLRPEGLKDLEAALRLSSKERARRLLAYLKGVRLVNVKGEATPYDQLSHLEQMTYADLIGEARNYEADVKTELWKNWIGNGPIGAILGFADRILRSNEMAAMFVDRFKALFGNLKTFAVGMKGVFDALKKGPGERQPEELREVIKDNLEDHLTPDQLKKIEEMKVDELKRLQKALEQMAKTA